MYHRNIYADTVLIACGLVSWPIWANPFIDEVGRDGGCDESVCNTTDLVIALTLHADVGAVIRRILTLARTGAGWGSEQRT